MLRNSYYNRLTVSRFYAARQKRIRFMQFSPSLVPIYSPYGSIYGALHFKSIGIDSHGSNNYRRFNSSYRYNFLAYTLQKILTFQEK